VGAPAQYQPIMSRRLAITGHAADPPCRSAAAGGHSYGRAPIAPRGGRGSSRWPEGGPDPKQPRLPLVPQLSAGVPKAPLIAIGTVGTEMRG